MSVSTRTAASHGASCMIARQAPNNGPWYSRPKRFAVEIYRQRLRHEQLPGVRGYWRLTRVDVPTIRKVGDRTESKLKTAIKKLFQFLAREKGITNEAVIKSFQR